VAGYHHNLAIFGDEIMKVNKNKNLASFYFIFWGNLATKKLPQKNTA
jgi:hypothetical protein